MADSSSDRHPLEALAEEFAARHRAGERPPLDEFCIRRPDLADQIRELFPALIELEQLKPTTGDVTEGYAPAPGPSDPERVGEFRILRRVGSGGMGVVYEAVQESLGRQVALKLLPPEALVDPGRLERFRREAKAAARLHHTNIVPVFGTGEADGRHYYAMQFIPGQPLDAVIDEMRRLKGAPAGPGRGEASEIAAGLVTGTYAGAARPAPARPDGRGSSPALSGSPTGGGRHYWDAVARVGAQVADALAHAHAQGVQHRDIKPSNLLLDLRGTVWVTDFGLAKASDAGDLTRAGDVVGTLRYLAPERFEGSGDHRADVYSLGLTLYEVLTLRPAFAADNRAQLVRQVTAAAPPAVRTIDPKIPRDLETIVLKATARDPAMRYQSAADMGDDLRRFAEDRPIRARRASGAEQAWRWCRRNPAVASLVAAVLAVSVAGATVAGLIARKHEKTADALRETVAQRDDSLTEVQRQQAALGREQEYTRRLLHISRINQGHAALKGERLPFLADVLRDTTPKPGEPDLRGWEWHWLARQLRPDREVALLGPGEPPGHGVVLSQDSERALVYHIADGGWYFTVKETRTGRPVGRVPPTGVVRRELGRENYRLERASPIFSVDGRSVLVFVLTRPTVEAPLTMDPNRTRLWDVKTGASVPVSGDLGRVAVEAGTPWADPYAVLGPGGAWLAWIESPDQAVHFGDFTRTRGPLRVVACRWDRATNRVTRSRPFAMGQDGGSPCLSPDGKTVYWQPDGPRGPDHGLTDGDGREVPRASDRPWLECWDVTGAEPRQRFKPRRLPSLHGSGGRRDFSPGERVFTLSPSATMIACRTGTGVLICRVADGGEHSSLKMLPDDVPEPPFGFRARSVVWVSDDGWRAVVPTPHRFTVLTDAVLGGGRGVAVPPAPGQKDEIPFIENYPAVRRIRVHDRADWYSDPTSSTRLLPDNKTLLDVNGTTARFWDDVSRDPARFPPTDPGGLADVERGGRAFKRMRLHGGGFTLEWPVRVPGDGLNPHLSDGPLAVLGANDEKVCEIIGAPAFVTPDATVLGGGRRLLINFQRTDDADPKWGIYDLADGGGEVSAGIGRLGQWGDKYQIELPGPLSPDWYLRSDFAGGFMAFLRLRDGRTGEVLWRIETPNRSVRFCGFDPTARTCLVESTETPAAFTDAALVAVGGVLRGYLAANRPGHDDLDRRSLRVHLFDTATGRELWAHDIAPDNFFDAVTGTQFSPDGSRILLRYETAPKPRERYLTRPDQDRIWVARPDGTVERDFLTHADPGDPTRSRTDPVAAPGHAGPCAWSPDGRHVAVPGVGQVEVWDLESGALAHRLTGHAGPGRGIAVAYSADGTRLFTRDARDTADPKGRQQVHVWDTATGRELLTLDFDADPTGARDGWLELVGDKLYPWGRHGGYVLDGTPVRP